VVELVAEIESTEVPAVLVVKVPVIGISGCCPEGGAGSTKRLFRGNEMCLLIRLVLEGFIEGEVGAEASLPEFET
jgi:hypothetical protein